MRTTAAAVIAALAAGCTTHFTGAAKVKNGAAGCRATCDGWGMELAGMVKMGEYSDGCICQVRATPPDAPAPGPSSDAGAARRGGASGLPAITGVHVQMEAAAAAAAAQSSKTARDRSTNRAAGGLGAL